MILTLVRRNNHWLISKKTIDGLEKQGKAKYFSHSKSVSIIFDANEAKIKFKISDNLISGTFSHKESIMQFTVSSTNLHDYFYWKKQNYSEKFLTIKTLKDTSLVKNNGKEIAQLNKKTSKRYQLKILDTIIPLIEILGSIFPIIL